MKYENGRLIDEDGNPHNMHDYWSTREYVPRVYDYSTKNQSFLNVHKLLKNLNIKNHSEHLQLFHPELIGVDPHLQTLTDQTRLTIIKECRMNLWYYLREVVKVPEGEKLAHFELNLGSFTITWLITRRQNFFYEIARQIGKTFLLTTILSWVLLFGGRRIKMANMHHSKDPAIDNLNKIKGTLDMIPEWMQFHKKEYDKVDKKTGKMKVKNILTKSDNARTLACKPFKNLIETVVVGSSLDSANRAGRGSTRHIYFIDEISHIKNNFLAMKSLQSSTSTARNIARKVGIPYGLWLLGTPGDLKTPHGKWMLNKIKNEFVKFSFHEVFLYDYTEKELNDYINARSISNYWHVKFDWDILGYDEKWFYDKNRNEEVSGIRAEVLLEWEESTTNSPFTRTQLAALESKSKLIKPMVLDYDDYNSFTIYPQPGENTDNLANFLAFRNNAHEGLIMGIDVANGTGRDYSTICMIDAKTLRIVATYKNNYINTDDFSLLIVHLLEDIVHKFDLTCAVGIERNNSGTSVIAKLKKYPHILKYLIAYPVSENKLKDLTKPADFDYYYNDLHVRADIGLNVDDRKRTLFTDDLLFTLVSKHTDVYAVPDIVQELRGLIRVKRLSKVRIEHSPETHDDLLFASFHAYYPAYYATEILRRNHNIIIEPDKWILLRGVEVFEGIKRNSRIKKSYESDRNGKLHILYYDTYTNKYISEKEAIEIEKNKSNSAIKRQEKIEEKKDIIIEGIDISYVKEEQLRKANRQKIIDELKREVEEENKKMENIQPNSFFDEEEVREWQNRNNKLFQIYDSLDSDNIRHPNRANERNLLNRFRR